MVLYMSRGTRRPHRLATGYTCSHSCGTLLLRPDLLVRCVACCVTNCTAVLSRKTGKVTDGCGSLNLAAHAGGVRKILILHETLHMTQTAHTGREGE